MRLFAALQIDMVMTGAASPPDAATRDRMPALLYRMISCGSRKCRWRAHRRALMSTKISAGEGPILFTLPSVAAKGDGLAVQGDQATSSFRVLGAVELAHLQGIHGAEP